MVAPAKREIRKLPTSTQIPVLNSCLALGTDPRPKGYRPIVGKRDLLRIRVGQYRVIYSVDDQHKAVIVVTIRKRGESTYKQIPLQDLLAKVRELENLLPTNNKVRPEEM
jgi:mRNA interferase RelE/StbE